MWPWNTLGRKILLCMILNLYYLSHFLLGILMLSVQNYLLNIPKFHGCRNAMLGMTPEFNSPLGACSNSLILEVQVFPGSPGEQLLQPKIVWSGPFQVGNGKARLREEIVLGRSHPWKMRTKLKFACFPASWPQETFLEAIGEKKKVKAHQRKTNYCYSIYSLWVVTLLATPFTSVLSFLITIFLSDYDNTVRYQQFP